MYDVVVVDATSLLLIFFCPVGAVTLVGSQKQDVMILSTDNYFTSAIRSSNIRIDIEEYHFSSSFVDCRLSIAFEFAPSRIPFFIYCILLLLLSMHFRLFQLH